MRDLTTMECRAIAAGDVSLNDDFIHEFVNGAVNATTVALLGNVALSSAVLIAGLGNVAGHWAAVATDKAYHALIG